MDLRREAKKGIGLQSVLIVILLLCIMALGAVIFIFFTGDSGGKAPETTDVNSVISSGINGLDTPQNQNPSEIFQYKINKSIHLKSPTDPAEIMLENSDGNSYLMWAKYQIKDTGEVIFTTEKLKPNEHIAYAKNEINVEKGTYDVIVSMMIEDIDTNELITVIEENVKLYIGEKPKGGN